MLVWYSEEQLRRQPTCEHDWLRVRGRDFRGLRELFAAEGERLRGVKICGECGLYDFDAAVLGGLSEGAE